VTLQPLVGPWPLLQFRNLFYTAGRTPWTGDQPVATPLPTHRTTQTQNKRIYRHSSLWTKTVQALDGAVTVFSVWLMYSKQTYLLTPSWGAANSALLKNFTAFYGTRRFITVFTRALYWPLSWARSIQSIPSYPISLRSILILFTHLRLGLPFGLFPSGFPTNIIRLLNELKN
jgi:hypothetical protein